MIPFYDLNQLSPMPLVEGDDHDQGHPHPLTTTTLPNDHNTSPLTCPIFFNTPQLQVPNNTDLHLIQHQTLHQQHQQQEFIDHFLIQESSNFPSPSSFSINTNNVSQRFLCDQQQTRKADGDQRKSSKWMSSKMRIMRKMMNPDRASIKKPRRSKQLLHQDQQNQQPPQDGVVRVCSDCNTTKTPLWRSGPCGPKSLCNACGIRQRKERRALAVAAAVSSGLIPAAAPNYKINQKEKESDVVDRTVPFKKRCRFSATTGSNNQKKKKLCFDDIVVSLSKSSAFHRVFPQDEKDAAILLMALSCGLMCS